MKPFSLTPLHSLGKNLCALYGAKDASPVAMIVPAPREELAPAIVVYDPMQAGPNSTGRWWLARLMPGYQGPMGLTWGMAAKGTMTELGPVLAPSEMPGSQAQMTHIQTMGWAQKRLASLPAYDTLVSLKPEQVREVAAVCETTWKSDDLSCHSTPEQDTCYVGMTGAACAQRSHLAAVAWAEQPTEWLFGHQPIPFHVHVGAARLWDPASSAALGFVAPYGESPLVPEWACYVEDMAYVMVVPLTRDAVDGAFLEAAIHGKLQPEKALWPKLMPLPEVPDPNTGKLLGWRALTTKKPAALVAVLGPLTAQGIQVQILPPANVAPGWPMFDLRKLRTVFGALAEGDVLFALDEQKIAHFRHGRTCETIAPLIV